MTSFIAPTAQQAVAADAFVQSIGINTHIDFSWSAYANLAAVQSALAYLGVQNVRDAIDSPSDLAEFAGLNQDLGVKFDFFIAPGDVGMPWQLQQIESDPSIVRFVEGANESDNWPQTYDGLSGLAATTAEQAALYASARSELPGVPVIAPSFGDLPSYAAAGDLSAYANAGNAHIYFGSGNNPGDQNWIQTITQTAAQDAPGQPVMTTETGYYTSTDSSDPNGVDPIVQAKYLLDDVMDQFKDGVSMDYLYELVDEGSDPSNPEDNFGLFTDNWTAKPAAVAIHDLMLLMGNQAAGGNAVAPGTLSYSLTGIPSTTNSLLFEKSDGTFVLSIWNDARLTGPVADADIAVPNVPVTLTLASPAAKIEVFDPLTGITAIESANNASQVTLSLPDHPILVEIGPDAGPPTTAPSPPPAPAPIPAAPTGLTLVMPNASTTSPLQSITVTGISIDDPWAAGMDGAMTINLSATNGTLSLTDAGGIPVAGSGSGAISLNANLFQLNTDLEHLTYTAGAAAGADTITVDVWDPSGLEATRTITVNVDPLAPVPPPVPPPALPPAPPPSPVGPAITAPARVTVPIGTSIGVGPITVADAFAASNAGTMMLNLSTTSGRLTATDVSGAALPGSGTASISVDGTLAQINADLAHLLYSAGGSDDADSIGIDIWDQAGQEGSVSIGVTVTGSQALVAAPALVTITIAAANADPAITDSDATVNAAAGNHQISVGGTGDTISATGGTETVMAFLGGNAITTGGGNDTIRIAGSGNVVNAGAGKNQIDDSGDGNTIVLPRGGQGTDDIYGYVMQNSDVFDLRALLAGTDWNGTAATIGSFVRIKTVNGADAVISAVPTGITGGASHTVATLHDSGPVSLPALLAQSIT
jgi:serralysin